MTDHAPNGGQAAASQTSVDQFLNPYAFVPFASRDTAPAGLTTETPAGHHQLQPGLWTGTLTVNMKTVSPLLSLDPESSRRGGADEPEHKVFKPATRSGEPYVAPTSVKGMLRAAYEAVTNSRVGVFPVGEEEGGGHQFRLAYRMTTQQSLRLVPARVVNGGEALELLGGTNQPGQMSRRDPQYAAWVPRYGSQRIRNVDESLLQHGQEVKAGLVAAQHRRGFRYWRVAELVAVHGELTGDADKIVTGWLCITGHNIKNKHDERLFFAETARCREELAITTELRDTWESVIRSYRAAHDHKEIWGRKGAKNQPWKYTGHQPGKTAWSRHLWDPKSDSEARTLAHGDLVYVLVENGKPVFLSPVMIGRRPFDASPDQLLPNTHRPALEFGDLSPADRVFGWVRPKKTGKGPAAYRGQLDVGPVRCEQPGDAIKYFENKMPLAILGTPKPTQSRFYVHTDAAGAKLAKGDWYQDPSSDGNQGRGGRQELKGRKFFVHHAGLDPSHWDPAPEGGADPSQQLLNGRYREYRRTQAAVDERGNSKLANNGTKFVTEGPAQQDSQNRSITGWIEPNKDFTFQISVKNLTDMELGALLWLVGDRRDPAGRTVHHRLGYGRPLGFGSVELRLDEESTNVLRGGEWATYWGDLDAKGEPGGGADGEELQRLASEFEEAARQAWPEILDAFIAIGAGDERYPVHYPRVRLPGYRKDIPVAPDPQGRAYEWFVQNERTGKNVEGSAKHQQGLERGLSPLPVHDKPERSAGTRRPPKGRGGRGKGGRR